jgi:PKD repeat protein
VNTEATATASFTDPYDTHTAVWDWGDGTTSDGTIDEPAGTVTGAHTYTAPGLYTVNLTLTDSMGVAATASYQDVVVYDPDLSVTGNGQINLPEGAYVPDPTLTGKVTFDLKAKYKKGASIPTGHTKVEFKFKKADELKFKSTSYDWLVIKDDTAVYKGAGTIKRDGDCSFMVTAIDGGKKGEDFIRIQIWNTDGTLVYDSSLTELDRGKIDIDTK